MSGGGQALAVRSFGFSEQQVRVVDRDGAAWFVANDVCAVLELGNSRDAVAKLKPHHRDCVGISDAMGRERQTTIVAEGGLYALVFKSRKPIAEAFQEWVTDEVLPAIRRTGFFVATNEAEPPASLMEEMDGPDDFNRQRLAQNMVRLALQVFGNRAARKAWTLYGLPNLEEEETAGFLLPNRVMHEANQTIADWMNACCEIAPGHRERSSALWADYDGWCRLRGLKSRDLIPFGRYLSACGITVIKSNGMWRLGLKVRKDAGGRPAVERDACGEHVGAHLDG